MRFPTSLRVCVLLVVAFAAAGCASRVSGPSEDKRESAPPPPSQEAVYTIGRAGGARVATVSLGIVRSIDGGASWSQVDKNFASQFVNFGPMIFGATRNGVVYSSDTGQNWTLTTAASGLPSDLATRQMALDDDNTLYAVGSYAGVYRSTDFAVHWAPASTGLPAGEQMLAITTRDGLALASTNDGRLFRSTDSGESWTQVRPGALPGSGYLSLAATMNRYYASRFSGEIYASADGLTWTQAGESLPEGSHPGRLVANESALYVITSNGAFRRGDSGGPWVRLPIGTPEDHEVMDIVVAGTTIYAATLKLGIQQSSDDGVTWTRLAATGGGPAPVINVDEAR